jgi:hypothetical protein
MRSRRWYEALSVLKPRQDRPEAEMQFIFEQGRKTHAEIESRYPGFQCEQTRTFISPELPFSIGYHPDLYDEPKKTVYEIKSESWFKEQPFYCLAQLSGYRHFLQAEHAVFLLYKRQEGKLMVREHVPDRVLNWQGLKRIALESDKMLLESPAPS